MSLDYIYLIPAYLIGCFITGYYLVRYMLKQDIREIGSKSAGITNVARVLGIKGIIITFVGDVSKGAIVVYGANSLNVQPHIVVLLIFAVVVGHIYPFHLDFRGGKGVATYAGGLFAYDYRIMLIIFVLVLILMVITRKRMMSGLVCVLIIPVFAFYLQHTVIDTIFLSLISLFVVYAHRENIKKFFGDLKTGETEKKSK